MPQLDIIYCQVKSPVLDLGYILFNSTTHVAAHNCLLTQAIGEPIPSSGFCACQVNVWCTYRHVGIHIKK